METLFLLFEKFILAAVLNSGMPRPSTGKWRGLILNMRWTAQTGTNNFVTDLVQYSLTDVAKEMKKIEKHPESAGDMAGYSEAIMLEVGFHKVAGSRYKRVIEKYVPVSR